MPFVIPATGTNSVPSFRDLQGVWRSRGYGLILKIERDGYVFFEETAISCQPVYAGHIDELSWRYEDLVVSSGHQAFSAHRVTGVARVGFRRLRSLPPTVTETEERDPDDPEYNFEVFWHTFAEHYALFALKGVDWDKAFGRFRPRITPDSEPETLFATLAAMLRPLRDGHIRLQTPWGHFDGGAQPALFKRLEVELDGASDHREVVSYLGELREWLQEIIHEVYLHGRVSYSTHYLADWGCLSDTTGYLNIRAMAGQSGKIGNPAGDLAATDVLMGRVMDELGHLPNLVVDIRGNGGGYDGVALRFASYLIDRKRLAFTKAARDGKGFTGRQAVYVSPAREVWRGNLYVLTSELTASAAEIFVLALLQHPRLTLIGEPTQGILSDTLERYLPNEWHMTLSNEVYRAYDGQVYEDVGIPPHIRLPFLGRKGRENDRDPMLDRVLGLTGG